MWGYNSLTVSFGINYTKIWEDNYSAGPLTQCEVISIQSERSTVCSSIYSADFAMKDGPHTTDSDARDRPITDETSIFLSPTVRRQPMTYFVYPGLDAPDLKGFLLENQASSACIQKAMGDLQRITPCPSIQNLSDSSSRDVSSISDDVFIDDIIEEPEKNQDADNYTADETLLDEVPLETPEDETDPALLNSTCNHEHSPKITANGDVPTKKKKGLSRFFISLCACGGIKSSKHKGTSSPITEL